MFVPIIKNDIKVVVLKNYSDTEPDKK